MMTVLVSAPPAMPKFLGLWFLYCLIIGFFVAYLAWHTLRWARELYCGVSRGGNLGVSGVRRGAAEQRNLEEPTVEHDDQRGARWIGVCVIDGGDVRVAVAQVKKLKIEDRN